jgi:hypothetical protein
VRNPAAPELVAFHEFNFGFTGLDAEDGVVIVANGTGGLEIFRFIRNAAGEWVRYR